ncbi:oxygenase MpaB family protein [Hamadaea sp. NPDC051192]|uniref:oxygenase MpaB family protein n=1 Tax=Hamadaea sp. NPDC051192 TaxID=3154940 RepID=UPI00343CEAF2
MDDAHRIYRELVLREFWPEIRVGLNLAFYRTYCVPRIARLLLGTGELTGRPLKRAYDTGVIMYELIAHGVDHPRGRQVLSALNRMHRAHDISDADYRYVLGTLVFIPTRWVDRYGPRPLTAAQRAATLGFYTRVGAAMGIPAIPATWEQFEAEFEEYERDNFAYDPAAAELLSSTKDLMVQRLPKPLRRFGFVQRMTAASLDAMLDQRARTALGRSEPGRLPRMIVHIGLRCRARLRRLRPVPVVDQWEPGRANAAYPGGYTLDQIGPSGTGR